MNVFDKNSDYLTSMSREDWSKMLQLVSSFSSQRSWHIFYKHYIIILDVQHLILVIIVEEKTQFM